MQTIIFTAATDSIAVPPPRLRRRQGRDGASCCGRIKPHSHCKHFIDGPLQGTAIHADLLCRTLCHRLHQRPRTIVPDTQCFLQSIFVDIKIMHCFFVSHLNRTKAFTFICSAGPTKTSAGLSRDRLRCRNGPIAPVHLSLPRGERLSSSKGCWSRAC